MRIDGHIGESYWITPYDLDVTYDIETGEPLLLDVDVFRMVSTSGFQDLDALGGGDDDD